MRFYVVSIQKTTDGAPASIFGYDTKKEALSAYHATLASNYVSEVLIGFCTMVVDEHGAIIAKEFYDEPIKVVNDEEIVEEPVEE